MGTGTESSTLTLVTTGVGRAAGITGVMVGATGGTSA